MPSPPPCASSARTCACTSATAPSWAELLARVFATDVWLCPHCGGRRRLLTASQEPAAIRKVLAAMRLSADAPELAAARSPPGEIGIEF